MKPLLIAVAALCLVLSQAHPENIEEVKQLPQSDQPIIEAEESEPQARKERCTTCTSGSLKLNLKSPNEVLAALQALPGTEVHTQQSYERCSSDKGCAGLKIKDGTVVERFGNVDAFKAAASADTANEFQFHAGGALGSVFENGMPNGGPFWWMNQNSPFKNAAGAGGGSFEKFSKSSSSFTSTGNAAGGGFGGAVDIAANPFLNGDFAKLGGVAGAVEAKPAGFQSSSFEASSFSSSSKSDVDLAKNPFLNGGIKVGQAGFAAQSGFGAGSGQFGASGAGASGAGFGSGQGFQQNNFGAQGSSEASQAQFGGAAFNANKFGAAGFVGSSPRPFSAATAGPNVNLIQNTQKASEFDFQQTQQEIDAAFQATGNVHAHEHTGGHLQQTCAGQGYVCVHKAQCNNGVVNMNGAGVVQAKTQKQYCNINTEICCRIEVSSLSGAGGLQGSLGVGSATFSGAGSQGSGLFTSGQSAQGAQSAFGQNSASFGQGSTSFGAGVSPSSTAGNSAGQGAFGSQSSFESNSFSSSAFGNRGTGTQNTQFGQGTQTQGQNTQFGQGTQGSAFEGAQGSGFSATGAFGAGSVNRGSSSGFESGFNANKATSSGFGASSSFGNGFSTVAPTTNRFGSNEVFKSTSQSNFIETDSFSAGSETAGIYRPGASGSGLKPGIPYLPPVDSVNQPSIISSTAIPTTFTTPRPFTTVRPTKPTYLPPPPPSSTSAPGYLPPEQSKESSNTKETRIPLPPTYNEGQLILDQNLPRQPTFPVPSPNDIPAGCAAALKCTPIEFCTADGVISNTTVVLTREQDAYRVPLTDCKDLGTGLIGKCCRDPLYTDPWPTNQLGKWVPGVFGGNDGKYVPDSNLAGNNPRPQVSTVRPPVTGRVDLNQFRPKPTIPPFGPNQVTPGFPSSTVSSFAQKGQFEVKGQGQFGQAGQGQFAQGGQGQFAQGGIGQFAQGGQSQFSQSAQGFAQGGRGQFAQGGQGQFVKGGQGQIGIAGQGGTQLTSGSQFTTNTQAFATSGQKGPGQIVSQGQGQFVEQGQGSFSTGGRGQYSVGGQGQLEIQGQGVQGQFSQVSGGSQKTFGQGVIQGQGQSVSQGQGLGVIQGQGQSVSQGAGLGVIRGQGALQSQGQGGFGVGQQGFGVGVSQGFGSGVSKGFGQGVIQGQGQGVTQGQGLGVIQGQGLGVTQGQGLGVIQGQGLGVSTGFGSGISQGFGQAIVQGEASDVYRVFLGQYGGSGQCGILNGQKPYGNRNDLEVDFAEIPWQAMVLLQTNRSLLCGGVITRPDVVLTSASCVEGLEAKNVLIKGGEWKLGIDDEPLPFQIVQVKNILRHPFYKSGSLKYDAAVLVLTENLRLAKNIYPICLPRASETLDAFYNGAGECIVTGWGKQVLQAHLAGSIMHSINVSLINPGECQAKLSSDYPHLLEQYDQESCACGQPLNPVNNICKVDIGSALACTTDNEHYVLRGIYSWDSGCQTGNQLAAFYKFDLEWYEWSIGLIESVRFAKYAIGTKVTQNKYSSQINQAVKSSSQYTVKGGSVSSGLKAGSSGGSLSSGSLSGGALSGSALSGGAVSGVNGQGQFGFSQFGSTSKFAESSQGGAANFGAGIKGPISNSFSATYSEKKVYQTEPKFITYTTKPEIVTFTTKPEYFTYTTKPKIVTYTTKPQIITYETSGSGTNPQYVAPGVTFNPDFSEIAGAHKHNAQCKCLEKDKK